MCPECGNECAEVLACGKRGGEVCSYTLRVVVQLSFLGGASPDALPRTLPFPLPCALSGLPVSPPPSPAAGPSPSPPCSLTLNDSPNIPAAPSSSSSLSPPLALLPLRRRPPTRRRPVTSMGGAYLTGPGDSTPGPHRLKATRSAPPKDAPGPMPAMLARAPPAVRRGRYSFGAGPGPSTGQTRMGTGPGAGCGGARGGRRGGRGRGWRDGRGRSSYKVFLKSL